MIAEIQKQARNFYERFSLRPDTLIISGEAWSMVRCELDAVKLIRTTCKETVLFGMRVIISRDIELFKLALAAWEE
jgi:hypothetical protein